MTNVATVHSLYSLPIVRRQRTGGGDDGWRCTPTLVSGALRVAMGTWRRRRWWLIVSCEQAGGGLPDFTCQEQHLENREDLRHVVLAPPSSLKPNVHTPCIAFIPQTE